MAMEVTEVSGFTGTLIKAIEDNIIDAPDLMGFNEFQVWRRDVGRRPTLAKDGVTRTTKEEVALWREVMSFMYGETWTSDLAFHREAQKASCLLYTSPSPRD